jgi:hypothetical protein
MKHKYLKPTLMGIVLAIVAATGYQSFRAKTQLYLKRKPACEFTYLFIPLIGSTTLRGRLNCYQLYSCTPTLGYLIFNRRGVPEHHAVQPGANRFRGNFLFSMY